MLVTSHTMIIPSLLRPKFKPLPDTTGRTLLALQIYFSALSAQQKAIFLWCCSFRIWPKALARRSKKVLFRRRKLPFSSLEKCYFRRNGTFPPRKTNSMSAKKSAPYGTWDSPITADALVSSVRSPAVDTNLSDETESFRQSLTTSWLIRSHRLCIISRDDLQDRTL
jgi:hypothetical protein